MPKIQLVDLAGGMGMLRSQAMYRFTLAKKVGAAVSSAYFGRIDFGGYLARTRRSLSISACLLYG